MNTSNSDNVIETSNLPHSNVQNYSPFNTLVNLKKVTYTESSISINYEITGQNNISAEMFSRQNSV